MNIITLVNGPVISFLEPSQLPGEYAAHAAKCVAQRAYSNTITISALHHRSPFILLGEGEAVTVKCLARGHKHHGRGQDWNPHSDDSAIRTQVRCTKPLGYGTPWFIP